MAEPINYFSDEAPGKSLAGNVNDEKMKLLRLIAEHGSTGQRIYDEAQNRSAASAAGTKAAVSSGPVNVPLRAIQEVAGEFDASLSTFRQIMEEDRQAADRDRIRRQSIEDIYKDSVAGDASLEANAQAALDIFEDSRRQGGGGGRGRSGPYRDNSPTIPVGLLEQDPTAVPGFDQGYFQLTGSPAPPVSIQQSLDLDGGRTRPAPPVGRGGVDGILDPAPTPVREPKYKSTGGGLTSR